MNERGMRAVISINTSKKKAHIAVGFKNRGDRKDLGLGD